MADQTPTKGESVLGSIANPARWIWSHNKGAGSPTGSTPSIASTSQKIKDPTDSTAKQTSPAIDPATGKSPSGTAAATASNDSQVSLSENSQTQQQLLEQATPGESHQTGTVVVNS